MHTDMVYHVYTKINFRADPDTKTRKNPLGKNSGTFRKLEVLFVGTGVELEWLHHVLYLLLYKTTVPSRTAHLSVVPTCRQNIHYCLLHVIHTTENEYFCQLKRNNHIIAIRHFAWYLWLFQQNV